MVAAKSIYRPKWDYAQNVRIKSVFLLKIKSTKYLMSHYHNVHCIKGTLRQIRHPLKVERAHEIVEERCWDMIAGSCWERVEMRRIGSREREFEIIEKKRGKVNVVSVVGLAKGLRFALQK